MEVILNVNDLTIEGLYKNLSLSAEKKSITTIAGSNNCGKTTLVRILDRKLPGNFNINLKGKDIKDYSLEEYNHLVQAVYPNEIQFYEKTPLEEMKREEVGKEKILFYQRHDLTKKLIEKDVSKLSRKERVLVQILLAIGKSEELVILDDIDYEFENQELTEIYEFIRKCASLFQLAFIITTLSLEHALLTDQIYVMKEGEVHLQGKPISIIQKDNLMNKAGLSLPFMIDLSVKLRDYDLIKNIEVSKERLIDDLWK